VTITVGKDHEVTEYAIYWPGRGNDGSGLIQPLGNTSRNSPDELGDVLAVGRRVIERFAIDSPDRPRGVIVSRSVEYTAWEE
jgi:hypothetical protein